MYWTMYKIKVKFFLIPILPFCALFLSITRKFFRWINMHWEFPTHSIIGFLFFSIYWRHQILVSLILLEQKFFEIKTKFQSNRTVFPIAVCYHRWKLTQKDILRGAVGIFPPKLKISVKSDALFRVQFSLLCISIVDHHNQFIQNFGYIEIFKGWFW